MVFPLAAQARDSSETVYETDVPKVGNETKPSHHSAPPGHNEGNGPGAQSSGTPNSGGGGETEGTSPSGNGEKHESNATGSANGGNNNGGGNGQGNEGGGTKSGGGELGQSEAVAGGSNTGEPVSQKSGSGGSSALLLVIIIVVVLAAISIGAFIMRQRRQRGSGGSPVSPKAS